MVRLKVFYIITGCVRVTDAQPLHGERFVHERIAGLSMLNSYNSKSGHFSIFNVLILRSQILIHSGLTVHKKVVELHEFSVSCRSFVLQCAHSFSCAHEPDWSVYLQTKNCLYDCHVAYVICHTTTYTNISRCSNVIFAGLHKEVWIFNDCYSRFMAFSNKSELTCDV